MIPYRLYECTKCKATMKNLRTMIRESMFVSAPICEQCFNKLMESKRKEENRIDKK